MRFLILCLLCFQPVLSLAGGGPSWFTSHDSSSQKWAVMPVYRRNSTYGHMLGGRFFIYPAGNTGYYTSLSVVTNRELFLSTTFSYQYWRENGDQLDIIIDYDGITEKVIKPSRKIVKIFLFIKYIHNWNMYQK